MSARYESVFHVVIDGGRFTPDSALEWLSDGEQLAHLVVSLSDDVDDPADRRALSWVGSEELLLRSAALDSIKSGKPEAVDWSEVEAEAAVDHLSRVLALRYRFDPDTYDEGFNVVGDVLARVLQRAKAERSAPGSDPSPDHSDEELGDEEPTVEKSRPSLWLVSQTAEFRGEEIEAPVPEVDSDDLVFQTYVDPDSDARLLVYPEPQTLTALLEDIPLERIPWLIAALREIADRCQIPLQVEPVVVRRHRMVPCDPPESSPETSSERAEEQPEVGAEPEPHVARGASKRVGLSSIELSTFPPPLSAKPDDLVEYLNTTLKNAAYLVSRLCAGQRKGREFPIEPEEIACNLAEAISGVAYALTSGELPKVRDLTGEDDALYAFLEGSRDILRSFGSTSDLDDVALLLDAVENGIAARAIGRRTANAQEVATA